MRKEDFNNALNHIDYELVEEYILQKERIQKRKAQRRAFVRLVPIAACFVLIATFAITLLPKLFDGFSEFKNEVFTTESAENFPQTPKDEESTGDVGAEGNGPSSDGPNYGKPDDGGQVPSAPSQAMYSYIVQYEGAFYTLSFDSLDEMRERSLSADDLGSYIITVNVYDVLNEKEKPCRIFNNLGEDKIIVELFEELYFIVE